MSAISKFLATPPDNYSTQISTASVGTSDLSFTVDDGSADSNLPAEGVGVLFKKDSDGDVVSGSIEFIHWTSVSGGTISMTDTGDRGLTGSDNGAQAYVADDYFEVWVTSYYYDSVRTGFDVEHATDGTHDTSLVADLTTAQTFTNKTLTSPVLNTGVSGTAVLDEDDMSSDSATQLATQQSIKAYVDANGGGSTDAARVYDASNQSINDATYTSVNFDSESFDTNTLHDTVTNNERITIQTTGKYIVTATVGFASNATGQRIIRIYKNGTTAIAFDSKNANSTGNTDNSAGTIVSLNATDYLTLDVYQNSGGALNVIGGDDRTSLAVHQLS